MTEPDDLSETELARLRAGDPRGLEALFERFGARIYRVCRGLLGQAADAEDAAQEVMLRIFDKAATFGGRSRFSTWVYRVAVHHCANLRRRPVRRWRLPD